MFSLVLPFFYFYWGSAVAGGCGVVIFSGRVRPGFIVSGCVPDERAVGLAKVAGRGLSGRLLPMDGCVVICRAMAAGE